MRRQLSGMVSSDVKLRQSCLRKMERRGGLRGPASPVGVRRRKKAMEPWKLRSGGKKTQTSKEIRQSVV